VTSARLARPRAWDPPLVFSLVAVAGFLVFRPPAGDLWAARARASAAAHGVGLHYWFSWFGGMVPGHYSVLAPYLSRVADVSVLGAATVAVILLCRRLVRDTRHPAIATWLAAVATAFSLWSGRVPFALGTAVALLALLAVLTDRVVFAALAGVAAALVSPVCGAFVIIGLVGVVLHVAPRRRAALAAIGGAAVPLLGVAAYFGFPGPEGFQLVQAVGATAATAALLLTRPAPYVRTVLIISTVASPLLAVIPNGLGSNFERFVWVWLPVATAATARARPSLTAVTAAAAVGLGIIGSTKDLFVAAQPLSRPSYFTNLNAQLDQMPGLAGFRLEVVPDGAHVAAYELLDHALLARGFETQSDNLLNAVLQSSSLDAARYRGWLDENAVGYVLIDRTTLAAGPEDRLVRSGALPYLHEIWSDAHWRLFQVRQPTPIVAAPVRMLDADQARLTVAAPRAGHFALRVRWSRFLHARSSASSAARLEPDHHGWTTFIVHRPGTYTISG
jgi:hypothetical protein